LKKQIFLFLTLMGSSLLSATDIPELQSFTANFKQTIVNEQNSHITYHGKLFAKKEQNKALWVYTSPIDKKIYYSKGKVVIIEPELEQAIFAKLDKVPNILTLLKKAKKIAPNTYVTTFNNTRYTITFKNGVLSKITYTDELHNRIKIVFQKQKNNAAIPESRFVYHIPEDYDILEQR